MNLVWAQSKVLSKQKNVTVFIYYSGHAFSVDGILHAVLPTKNLPSEWINLYEFSRRCMHNDKVLVLSVYDCSRTKYKAPVSFK